MLWLIGIPQNSIPPNYLATLIVPQLELQIRQNYFRRPLLIVHILRGVKLCGIFA